MGKHLVKDGFMPGYHRWTMHGERHRVREEVVRQRINDYDSDAGVGDMFSDFDGGHIDGQSVEQEPEATAKAYYDMLQAAQQPYGCLYSGDGVRIPRRRKSRPC